jgi:lycopene cyclase domain-containing protein
MFTYLIINLIAIAFPLTFTWYKKIAYNTKLRYLLPAIAVTALFFIVWDILFTHLGVWGFNASYLVNIYLFNLPIEEILFFIFIPYSSIFIYESLIAFKVKDIFQPYQNGITLTLFIGSCILFLCNMDKYYTASTFGLGAIFWLLHLTVIKKNYLSRFYLAYLIILVPFFITNGILTGTGLESPVVWYNDAENLGIRMLTIPVEDTFYGMLLIAASVTLMEKKMSRFS